MGQRHCLKIPFLIGQRNDSIIGNSCADNPLWEVPCNPGDFPADVDGAASFPELVCASATIPADTDGSASLPEPAQVLVSL